MWKFDLRAAFLLVTYATCDVCRLAVELTKGLVMVFWAGVFGLTGMPIAFHVITSAIVWEVNRRITGRMCMYVDDGMGVSRKEHVRGDLAIATGWVRELAGPNAIAEDKSEVGESGVMVAIGYSLDLMRGVVGLSENNMLKTLFMFLSVDLRGGGMVSVKRMQALASLGTRVSDICPIVRPFTRVLYGAFAGSSGNRYIQLSRDTKSVIKMFRCILVLMFLRGLEFNRSFSSFSKLCYLWALEFDASLTGLGIIWFRVGSDGDEEAVAYATVDTGSLGLAMDSSYQNFSEFLAALFAIVGVLMLGGQGEPLRLRGDSMSALKWCEKGVVRSGLATMAGVVWGALMMKHEVHVADTVHLKAELNQRTDCLSRGGTWGEVMELDQRLYGGRLKEGLKRIDFPAERLLNMCDPRRVLEGDGDYAQLIVGSFDFLQ
jgi:hypothetical protein